MIKNKKLIIPLIILVLALVVAAVLFLKPKFNLSDNEIIKSLNGKSLGTFTVKDGDIKKVKVLDKSVKSNNATIVASLDIEYIEKGAGMINEYQIKNDVVHTLSEKVNLNYIKNNGNWVLDTVSDLQIVQSDLKEQKTELKETKFKTATEIMEDFKSQNIGIPADSNMITYGQNKSMGYITITKSKDFTVKSVEDKSKILKEVTIHIDAEYDINNENDTLNENGHYNVSGDLTVLYRLTQDKSNTIWDFVSVKDKNLKVNKN